MEPVQESTAAAAAPGIYNAVGTPGGLAFWTGSQWDPRPVASVWSRLWALAIDLVITFILAVPLLLLLELVAPASSGSSSTATSLPSLLLAQVIYFTVCYAAFGYTVGMWAARINVVSINTQGSKLSLSAALLRSLVLCVSLVVPFLALVWLIWTSSSSTRRGPQDLASGSAVLRRLPHTLSSPTQGNGEPEGDKTSPRGRPAIVLSALGLAIIVLAAVAVYADSRMKTTEMRQLLDATEASEAVMKSFMSRNSALSSEYDPRADLCGQDNSCLDYVLAEWRSAEKSAARDHLVQLQESALEVEDISGLPWHGDVTSAKDAYLEHVEAWLEDLDYTSTYDFEDFSQSRADSLSNEIARSWVVAERRFRDVTILLAPDDIPSRIEQIFSN